MESVKARIGGLINAISFSEADYDKNFSFTKKSNIDLDTIIVANLNNLNKWSSKVKVISSASVQN